MFAAGSIAALTVAGLDLWLPAGFVGGFPYVPVVLISLLSAHRSSAFIAAAVCTILSLISYLCSSAGFDFSAALGARLMAASAMWLTAYCCRYGSQLMSVFDEMLGTDRPARRGRAARPEPDTGPPKPPALQSSEEPHTQTEARIPQIVRPGGESTEASEQAHVMSTDADDPLESAVSERKPRSHFERHTQRLTIALQQLESENARLVEVEQSARAAENALRMRNEQLAAALAAAEAKLDAEAGSQVAVARESRNTEEQLRHRIETLTDALSSATQEAETERGLRRDAERKARANETELEHQIKELSEALVAAEEALQRQSGERAEIRVEVEAKLEGERLRHTEAEEAARANEADLRRQLEEQSRDAAVAKQALHTAEAKRAEAEQAMREAADDLRLDSDERGRELDTMREELALEKDQRLDAEHGARELDERLRHRIDELTSALAESEEALARETAEHSETRSALDNAEETMRHEADERVVEFEKIRQEADAVHTRRIQEANVVEEKLTQKIAELSRALSTAKTDLDAEIANRNALADELEQLRKELHQRAELHAAEPAAIEPSLAVDPSEQSGTHGQPSPSSDSGEARSEFAEIEPTCPALLDERDRVPMVDHTAPWNGESFESQDDPRADPPRPAPAEAQESPEPSTDSDEAAQARRFVSGLRDSSYAIRQSLRDEDFDALATLAGDLVAPAEHFGYSAISEAAKELETAARARQLDQLANQVKHLRSLCELGVIGHSLWTPPRAASATW